VSTEAVKHIMEHSRHDRKHQRYHARHTRYVAVRGHNFYFSRSHTILRSQDILKRATRLPSLAIANHQNGRFAAFLWLLGKRWLFYCNSRGILSSGEWRLL
jgi:hypothetical protein